jgi:hypothetical protein
MKTTSQKSYGKPITWEEATEMINTHGQIKNITETKVNASKAKGADPALLKKAKAMIDSNHQAFIFSKECIMRFFDGSEKDEHGNPVSANYLMVILGAHHGKTKGYEGGTLNVITTGCEKKVEKNAKGKAETRYYPLKKLKFTANEYGSGTPPPPPPPPPGGNVVRNKTSSAKHSNSIDYFVGD